MFLILYGYPLMDKICISKDLIAHCLYQPFFFSTLDGVSIFLKKWTNLSFAPNFALIISTYLASNLGAKC